MCCCVPCTLLHTLPSSVACSTVIPPWCCSLSVNLAGPTALLEAFAAVQQELKAAEGSEGHLAMWLVGQHSMQETDVEIDRLMKVTQYG